MKPYRIIILVLLVANGIGVYAQEYTQNFRGYFYDQRRSFFEAMPDTENEIIMLGNSITNGASWDELFPDVNIKNRGISSDITLGVLDRLDEVVSSKPLKVFILIGVNDIARNIPIDTIMVNYKQIVRKIQQSTPNTKIYIQSLMPTNSDFSDFKNHQGKIKQIKQLNKRLEALSTETGTGFIDLYPHFEDETGKLSKKYTNDGLHLMGAGYIHWTSILKTYIYE